MELNASDGIQIGVGVVLTLTLGAVLCYAWEARKQAKASERIADEMLETRHGTILPVIDFVTEEGSGAEAIVEVLRIQEGILPEELPARLQNIGFGPALDIRFQVKLHDMEPVWKHIPRVRVEEYVKDELTSLEQWHVFLEPTGGSAKRLTVEFHNVYGRAYRSWRDVTFDLDTGDTKVGPLQTRAISVQP
ncbi:MAG: hypothetical protein GTO63_26280 [Anaerolineae bacterium]|nr:hypothetical protein [Anaerolineae bacterium]NIN98243.1 hypothetical protein [Anaerolineae bacterium]NIQ81170.1 hypothetical protein [Anaerolineae bacterium]